MVIFLIGFMGSGKSYTGKRLAKLLEYDFLDLDEYLEQEEGSTITEIFTQQGEQHFRSLEHHYLLSLAGRSQLVVATGGGTPCQAENLQWMKDHGLVIYLKTPIELLVQRLQTETETRPLIASLAKDDLVPYIKMKMSERSNAYEAADVIVEQEKKIDAASLVATKLFGKSILST